MTRPVADRAAEALAPVRAEVLRAARADAEQILARAAAEDAARLERARTEARTILGEARRLGEADGVAAARGLLVAARREARARALTVRREAYEDLRRTAAERVGQLRDTAEGALLRERLEERARALLGPGAEVSGHPDGGVVARAPGRRVDFSLTTLAERALDRMGAEVRHLWEP
ncbi:hypothetical protein ACFYOV_18945 [Streptomyces sp. NPDC005931]|uniref:hypothetical protein n=1 Tax=Streptomyces sp. NPDC005931 TaxID=3364737 RepID=UPI0036CB25CE